MPDTGQGISAGDAVLSLLVDMQPLDAGLDTAETKTKAWADRAGGSVTGVGESFKAAGSSASEAGDEMEEAGQRTRSSMHEATGEVALLGEEFGVRLPRHVRSFVTELPGVGEALTAAFSATAVLFLVQALVEGAEKLSSWIGSTLIFTQAMKDSDTAIAAMNKTLLESKAESDAAKESLEKFGAVGQDLQRLKIADAQAALETNKQAIDAAQQQIGTAHQAAAEYREQTGWISKSWDIAKAWYLGETDQATVLHNN